jgi:hypothetical protein
MASDEIPPFPRLGNYPTQAEVLFHKNAIKSLEQDISNIEDEISKLHARLRCLQQKKANHASYISPLRRLPPEILSEIIYICLYNEVKLTTLTQICGAFRDVVVGMSNLWNEILLFTTPRLRPNRFFKPWVRKYFYNLQVHTKGSIGTPLLQNSSRTRIVPHASGFQTITHSYRISAPTSLAQSSLFK